MFRVAEPGCIPVGKTGPARNEQAPGPDRHGDDCVHLSPLLRVRERAPAEAAPALHPPRGPAHLPSHPPCGLHYPANQFCIAGHAAQLLWLRVTCHHREFLRISYWRTGISVPKTTSGGCGWDGSDEPELVIIQADGKREQGTDRPGSARGTG